MGKNKKKSVVNNKNKKRNVNNTNVPKGKSEEENLLTFDFSFEGLYFSVKLNDTFNNYLSDEKEFVEKFRQIREINAKLKDKKFNELLIKQDAHCHKVPREKFLIAKNSIIASMKKYDSNIDATEKLDQILGNEQLYQIGLKGVRLIGIHDETLELFKVFLIDYHHDLHYQQKYNTHSKRDLKFCPMTTQK